MFSVPVAPTSITIPVAPTSITVPVATVTGTTNAADGTGAAVVVPVTASGSVLDVKIVEISSTAPVVGGVTGVAPTEAFEAAMEDALNDATDVDVNIASVINQFGVEQTFEQGIEEALDDRDFTLGKTKKGVIIGNTNAHYGTTGPIYFKILRDDGDIQTENVVSVNGGGRINSTSNFKAASEYYTHRVILEDYNSVHYPGEWIVESELDVNVTNVPALGTIVSLSSNSSNPSYIWTIRLDNGTIKDYQQVYTSNVYTPYNTWITQWDEKIRGARVAQYTNPESFVFVKQN